MQDGREEAVSRDTARAHVFVPFWRHASHERSRLSTHNDGTRCLKNRKNIYLRAADEQHRVT